MFNISVYKLYLLGLLIHKVLQLLAREVITIILVSRRRRWRWRWIYVTLHWRCRLAASAYCEEETKEVSERRGGVRRGAEQGTQ